jgi:tRNA threonylcarbamoyl adenosine modification protein YeaZ
MTHDGRRRAILAIDTATTRVVIATGSPDGVADGVSTWTAGYRHGETLLPSIGRFLGEQNIRRSRLVGIVVGTGPGAFTGLRVGIATAKGLAHGLGIPLVGVSTAEALIESFESAEGAADAAGRTVLLLPAGPSDRIVVRGGTLPVPLPAVEEPDLAPGERLVAVDLAGRAPEDAVARGETARAGLGQALLRGGAAKLAQITADGATTSELETLVPDYVTLPRGVRATTGTVEWSRDPR